MAYDVSKAFERIENDLLDSMIRNLGRHKAEETAEGFEWEQWQVAQLKELERFKRANAKKYGREFANINSKISTAIQEAYRQGMDDEEMSILEAILKRKKDTNYTKSFLSKVIVITRNSSIVRDCLEILVA